jgi:UDP-2,4-diacetamido-2,4,6-trideoxy-beta-L-altropyranose hydrolase
MMPFRVAIRADGNSEIGFGHIIRTQALADQLKKRGAEVIFLTRNPENISGYPSCLIPGDISLAEEDGFIAGYLVSSQQDMLIIDNYLYDQERLDKAGQLDIRTVYIDDMNLFRFNVDFVLNGNLYAPKVRYQGRARFILGSEYLLMREAFRELPVRTVKSNVNEILLTFGAADMNNCTPRLLEIIREYYRFNDLKWQVVIGPAFRNLAELRRLADYANISLHYNPDIKILMDFVDIAISAAGSTSYELAACGVPSILFVVADNQRKLAEEVHKQGLAINGGWFDRLNKNSLFKMLDALIVDYEQRQRMVIEGQKIIDGRGAERVAEILLSG